jgi:hypothetical protein
MGTPEQEDPEVHAAELEKIKAEATGAKVKAQKEEREEREASEPGAEALRDAERRQKIAESEKAAAAAKRDQVANLIPDFKDVERGTLEDKSEKPLFEAALAQRALASTASAVANRARGRLDPSGGYRVLVTSDTELVVSDGTYHDVVAGLSELSEAAEEALREPVVAEEETAPPGEVREMAVPAISAVAAAVPALLGVFSAKRTLKSADIQKNDLAGATAVAGALATAGEIGTIVHDDFRLLPTDGVYRKHADLVTLRRRLAALKLVLEDEKAQTPDTDKQAHSRIAVRLGLVDSVSSAIDTFNASIVAVPEGSKRSPLAMAAARERLHAADENDAEAFTHVLLVKSEGGSAHQTVDDKPFLMKDKVSIFASMSINWLLIRTDMSSVVDGGTVGGSATAHGKIGDRFDITFSDHA